MSSDTSTFAMAGADHAWSRAGTRATVSRAVGALFLLGFLSYGTGFALVSSQVGAPDFVVALSSHPTLLVGGAMLMLLNSLVDVGKGVLLFSVVEPHGKRTALVYFAAMLIEVVLLAFGILCLLMLPAAGRLGLEVSGAQAIGSFLVQSNTMAYQLAMLALSVGNILLWALSFRVRLLPRWLSGWGVAGYVIFAAGATAEIFGLPLSLMASIPGGLFEITLGAWLIFKGFNRAAFAGPTGR